MTEKHTITQKVGDRTFELDMELAKQAFDGKRILGGRQTPHFNLYPARYPWALDLYKKMKSNHWEPEDIGMGRDIEQWKSDLPDIERWIIKMAVGYFSAAEGIVGDNVLHVIRELVTAPELKLVLGRHAHEENIHADSLMFIITSLGLNPHECEAMFESIPTVKRKSEFVTNFSKELRRDLDMKAPSNIALAAKDMFLFGQCMEGTQFYGLFGMILALYRQNKFRGIGEMFRYTLRDESNHIELLRRLFNGVVEENPEIWTDEFREGCRNLMREAVTLEKAFIKDCLPQEAIGLTRSDFIAYIEFIADRRLESCNLEPITGATSNPLPWLAEMMDLKKEENFFESRVTEYSKSSRLEQADDNEL